MSLPDDMSWANPDALYGGSMPNMPTQTSGYQAIQQSSQSTQGHGSSTYQPMPARYAPPMQPRHDRSMPRPGAPYPIHPNRGQALYREDTMAAGKSRSGNEVSIANFKTLQ
jgi:hypothetical protein